MLETVFAEAARTGEAVVDMAEIEKALAPLRPLAAAAGRHVTNASKMEFSFAFSDKTVIRFEIRPKFEKLPLPESNMSHGAQMVAIFAQAARLELVFALADGSTFRYQTPLSIELSEKE